MIPDLVEPGTVDEMLMWGARAAASLMESARDRRDGNGIRRARAQFDGLVAARNSLQPPPFEVIATSDLIQPAMKALFAAESARFRAGTATSSAWEEAANRCRAAGMRWDEALASWRWAQALFHEGANRSVVAVPLRSAHRFVVEVGALSLQLEVESLATVSKVRLDEPSEPSRDQPPAPFRSLTRPEQEVLSYLVAGRTYAEIARALFISESTVSVHVSNLLRKTGTSSRREVSALALRLTQSSPADH
ncbi:MULTISPECIES: helix-turn-helix transcriptional regulator [Kribbella]|nr:MULTISPECIES: helix-turn-helix transcriptional regulator [Kribbella]